MKKILCIILTIMLMLTLMNFNVYADVQISDINSGWYWPTLSSTRTITSEYGRERTSKIHQGIDIAGGSGDPIYASRYGDVVGKGTGYNYGMGNSVTIYHGEWNGNRIYTTYMHLYEPASVNIGDTVNAGQQIGKMGSTGDSTGTHLHFQISKGDSNPNHYTIDETRSNFVNTNPSQTMFTSGMFSHNRIGNPNYPYSTYGNITYTMGGQTPTPTKPDINKVVCSTNDAYNIKTTSATLSGTFSNPTGAKVVKRGFQWGANTSMTNYTWFDCDITWNDGLTHNMTGLSPDTTYYYKMIVKGEDGKIIYGNMKSFSTQRNAINSVSCTTNNAYNIGATSATLSGTFSNPTGAKVVKRGFQWGTTTEMCNYTWFDCDITWNDGLTHNMTGLSPNTTYYYKMVVKGEDGTTKYGNSASFTTKAVPDTDAPNIVNLHAANISSKSFDIIGDLIDNNGVTSVWIVIYCPSGEKRISLPASNGTFKYTVNTADCGGSGRYAIHFYAYDANKNSSKATISEFQTIDDNIAPTVSNLKVTNLDKDAFYIECDLWDNIEIGIIWLILYSPSGEHRISINGSNGHFSYPINTAQYGGKGSYSIHLYVNDAFGNSSGMVPTGAFSTTYIINYDGNGGDNVPNVQIKEHGKNVALSNNVLTRQGYVFWGWAENDPYANNATYPAGGTFAGDYSTTLYAVWRPATYNVAFNSMGGSIVDLSKEVTYQSTYGDLPTSELEGNIFKGWYTSPVGGTQVTSNSTVRITDNQTLYAQWEYIPPHTKTQVVRNGNSYNISIEQTNLKYSKIIVAGYKDGMISSMEILSGNNIQPITFTGDFDTFKVMAWESFSTLKPLCNAEIIPKNKWIIE